ncbi:hypothetical protein HPP92_023488 [Vanilla planifolia]|uniref:tRNA (guanine(46)-N(7))-methyltransferase n=1 Tax=Vanilla planifolia TaxID=51239 RepID=A0A835PNJ7_VANPL|nr:hypothetical protein HPP92_023488 [Vanilla planifolia]
MPCCASPVQNCAFCDRIPAVGFPSLAREHRVLLRGKSNDNGGIVMYILIILYEKAQELDELIIKSLVYSNLKIISCKSASFQNHWPWLKPCPRQSTVPMALLSPKIHFFAGSRRRLVSFIRPTEVRSCCLPCRRNSDYEGAKDGVVRSSDLVEREYAELNLKEIYGEGKIGRLRIRQHVNPLSSAFRLPVPAPDWNAIYNDSKLPLMVDIGSGSGRFVMWLAKHFPESRNYLGLEIREKLVQRCLFWVKELALRNIHFIFSNATVSFEGLVSSYPGPLVFVSILCPDPHFKNRLHKRRVLQKPLVDSILNNLVTGGQVFLQSDVHEVAIDMRSHFDRRVDAVKHVDAADGNFLIDEGGWLLDNPVGIRTEREIHAEMEVG